MTRKWDTAMPAAGSMIQRYWPVAPLVLAQLVVALGVDLPVVRPVLALFALLGLPTLLLSRREGFPGDSGPARVLYAFGVSLLGVILIGLVLSVALPLVGIDHPLRPTVLAVVWLLVDLALLRWCAESVPALPTAWGSELRRLLGIRMELAQALAVASVVLAVLGAVRLNNGAGGGVALVALVLAAAGVLALLLRPGSLGRDARCLALVAASLLLATSLRGWYITGHDIQAEYLAFQLTNDGQHWQMSALQNAYNACLSVNILPTVLAQATGLPGTVVFKLLLQLVFALVPVLTFLFAQRFLPRRPALVAASFTIAFPTFFTDMPYLVRQEIAFFFLALVLCAATEPGRPKKGLRLLIGFFGLGVVLSHYSTTYVLLLGLVFGLLALLLSRLVRRVLRREQGAGAEGRAASPLVLLNPLFIVFLTVTSVTWAGPVTHTAGHASDVARETLNALTGKGSEGPGSSDTSYRLFSRDSTTPRERLDLYVHKTLEARRTVPARELLIRHPGKPETHPEIVPAPKVPLTGLGRALDSTGIDTPDVNSAMRIAGAGFLQVFLLVGLVVMVLRRRSTAAVPREVAFLSIGGVAALGLIVLIPNLSVEYGVLRAFQQTMLVVSPVMAVGLWTIVRPLGSRAGALAVLVPVALLLVFTGVVPSVLGGYPARLALSNSGPYYDRYYATEAEEHAISWLAMTSHDRGDGSKLIANRNIEVRILAATRNRAPVADQLYPTLLTRGSYVFVNAQTRQRGESTVFYTGDLITYVYPVRDLDQRLNLVYSSPSSRIYR